jgi:hypothetical protein
VSPKVSPKVSKEMVDLASHIPDTKAGHFDPFEVKDAFEIELKKLVRHKAAGNPLTSRNRSSVPPTSSIRWQPAPQGRGRRQLRRGTSLSISSERWTFPPGMQNVASRIHIAIVRCPTVRANPMPHSKLCDTFRATDCTQSEHSWLVGFNIPSPVPIGLIAELAAQHRPARIKNGLRHSGLGEFVVGALREASAASYRR